MSKILRIKLENEKLFNMSINFENFKRRCVFKTP